jgi:hypothetical protein
MTLAERIEEHQPRRRPSALERLLTELSLEDLAALRNALADPDRVSAPALSDILRAEGHDVSAHQIKDWRRKNGIGR